MKALTCEMCGSTDLVKHDGVFVCQACGTKYSVEEAKKMMVEGTVSVSGTVKIDNTEELSNKYLLARRAVSDKDWQRASSLYDEISTMNPLDWEPHFYSLYSRARLASSDSIIETSRKIIANCKSTVELIYQNDMSPEEKTDTLTSMAKAIKELASVMSSWAITWSRSECPDEEEYLKYLNRVIAATKMNIEFGDYIYITFSDDIKNMAAVPWLYASSTFNEAQHWNFTSSNYKNVMNEVYVAIKNRLEKVKDECSNEEVCKEVSKVCEHIEQQKKGVNFQRNPIVFCLIIIAVLLAIRFLGFILS